MDETDEISFEKIDEEEIEDEIGYYERLKEGYVDEMSDRYATAGWTVNQVLCRLSERDIISLTWIALVLPSEGEKLMTMKLNIDMARA